jgi:hypothetical protein
MEMPGSNYDSRQDHVGVESAIRIWRDVVLHDTIHWQSKVEIEVEFHFFNLTKSIKKL